VALCITRFVIAADDPKPAPVTLISPQRLIERIQAGEPIAFVDVRQPEEYAQGHIPGAINVPSGELSARRAELPRGSVLIPYCNMDFRGFVSARELEALGFEVALLQERGSTAGSPRACPSRARGGQSDAAALAKSSRPRRRTCSASDSRPHGGQRQVARVSVRMEVVLRAEPASGRGR
jgi:rhodanese-related sulfurtransferase